MRAPRRCVRIFITPVEDNREPRARRIPRHAHDVQRNLRAVLARELGQLHREELRRERGPAPREVHRRHLPSAATRRHEQRRARAVAAVVPVRVIRRRFRSPRRGDHRRAVRPPLRRGPSLRLPQREPTRRVRREEVSAARGPRQSAHARDPRRDGTPRAGADLPHGGGPPIRGPRREQPAAR